VHLYGRKLVLSPAQADAVSVDEARAKAKRAAERTSQAAKRQKLGAASQKDGAFEDVLL